MARYPVAPVPENKFSQLKVKRQQVLNFLFSKVDTVVGVKSSRYVQQVNSI